MTNIQDNRPTEEEAEKQLRENYVHYRVQVGTPWDGDRHLTFTGALSREDFVLSGFGALATAVHEAAMQIEFTIRNDLIPQWSTATEENKVPGVDGSVSAVAPPRPTQPDERQG